jgi:dephospho-CoA kinase
MKLIVLLVGMPGSGKEEFARVAEKRGFTVVRMGDTVREEARKRGVEPTDKNVGSLAHSEREKSGYGVWAIRTLSKINRSDEKNVLVDGCRGDSEVAIFKQNFSDLDVVAIFSSPEARFDRMRQRKRSDSPFTLEEFYERDQRELKWGIGNAFIMADYIILNEGSLDEYRKEINRVLDKIGGRKR